ncbi:alpha/beta hydrolase [Bauldia sp.]|uniref:alpha/beta hydrolase n=1 Tax=Bauldia sp. TaxID=2575872 RepID=UPI003BABDFD7
MKWTSFLFALLVAFAVTPAEAYRLEPYKDDLFKYPRILGTAHSGSMVIVEFDDARDVGGRDEIRLKKAYDKFVDLSVNDAKKDLTIEDKVKVRYVGVGQTEGDAKMVVIYLHGRHGDRTLAQEDLRFGGNFNRVKNLMWRNDGVYITPDFSNFGRRGVEEMKALMRYYRKNSPDAPIVIAGASTGAQLIYRLMSDPEAVELLDGIILHGPLRVGRGVDRGFFDQPVFTDPSKHIPIYIGHASADPTVPWPTSELFMEKVKAAAPGYPIRFELFKGTDAVHGTPIRMMDWRLVLNWILEQNEALS